MKRNWSMWFMLTVMGIGIFAIACDEASSEKDTATVDDSSGDTSSGTEHSSESDTLEDTGDDTDAKAADIINIKLNVPSDFDGSPEILAAMFFTSSAMDGMPSAFGQSISGPEIVAGEAFEFNIPQTDLSGNALNGTYYMALTLYCEGGGGGQFPVEGVDWVAGNGEGLTLGPGTGTVDAGEMTLMSSDK